MKPAVAKAKAAAVFAGKEKDVRSKRRIDAVEKEDTHSRQLSALTRVTNADIDKAVRMIEGPKKARQQQKTTMTTTTRTTTTTTAASASATPVHANKKARLVGAPSSYSKSLNGHKLVNNSGHSSSMETVTDGGDDDDDDDDEIEGSDDDDDEEKEKEKETKAGSSNKKDDGKKKQPTTTTSATATAPGPSTLTSNASRWINKQRVLALCSRGVTFRARHLINDLRTLMPHSKKDVKLDKKDKINIVNEVCELKNCNNCLFLEMRKKQDMFLWMSKTPSGPSVKFHIESINTMDELRMTGNCLKGSRPILSFDKNFETAPHLSLLKELFIQIFGTPKGHPKSKPFIDRVMSFSVADNRIWFRNFQIIDQPVEKGQTKTETTLNEIGPRFVLNIVRIFDGSFGGATIYENPDYVSPNEIRAAMRKKTQFKYSSKVASKEKREEKEKGLVLPKDEVEDVFRTH